MAAVIVALVGLLALARRDINRLKRHQTGGLSGIGAKSVEQTKIKNKNKARIMLLFESQQIVTNADIREFLGVSRRTVVRYLDELEAEEKIKQIGGIGRGVGYRRKP